MFKLRKRFGAWRYEIDVLGAVPLSSACTWGMAAQYGEKVYESLMEG